MKALLFFAALLYLLLPGVTLWWWLNPARGSWRHAINGLSFGFAFVVCMLFLISLLGLDVFLWTWGAPFAAAVYYGWRKRDRLRPASALSAGSKWLLLVLGLAAILRFLPLPFHQLPRGWDPYFHLLLVEKILSASGHIHDWLPFEDIPLRYPLGSHLLLAAISRLSTLPSHAVFKLLLALLGTLTCAQVYALVRSSTRDRQVALFSTAAFGLLALLGSLDYYRWGGLANLLGLYLFLGALSVLSTEYGRRMAGLLPFFFVGLGLCNTHVLAAAVLVLGPVLIVLLSRRASRGRAWVLLAAAGITLVVDAILLLPGLLGQDSMGGTGLFLYGEEQYTVQKIIADVGLPYVLLTLLGGALWALRRAAFPVGGVLLVANAAMLVLFVGFEYGGRALTQHLLQRDIAPFTPGRFLTDAIPLLAVFPGLTLAWLQRRTKYHAGAWLLAILLLSALNLPYYCAFFKPVIPPPYVEAYQWIRRNTSPDTVVLARHFHAPYLTRRACSNTPIPSSEQWSRAHKKTTMQAILQGKVSPAVMKAPVVLVSGNQRGKVLWKHPAASLYVTLVYDHGAGSAATQ